MVKRNTKKIDYWFNSEEDGFKRLAFLLFDMLDFKRNIAIIFFRTSEPNDLYEFQNIVSCKVVRDIKYLDRYCVLISEMQSNTELNQLMQNNYEYPTECTYMQLQTDFESFLFNQKYLEKDDAISCGLAIFEALLDHEGIHLKFDLSYYDLKKIENILTAWENMLQGIKFTKN